MAEIIKFYKVSEVYGFLSNFAPYPIRLKGKQWLASEQYFQAQKFAGIAWELQIRRVRTPLLAAKMGRDRSKHIRPDWDSVKDKIMRQAVAAKFAQHPELRDKLLKTNNAKLIEDAPDDTYWGCGRDGRGLNRLGMILMEVREKLVQSSFSTTPKREISHRKRNVND